MLAPKLGYCWPKSLPSVSRYRTRKSLQWEALSLELSFNTEQHTDPPNCPALAVLVRCAYTPRR